MKKIRVSVAMFAALAVCAVVQNASPAQGGVLLPETTTAPVVRHVPNVVEYPAKKVVRTEAAMPTPRSASPMKAAGRIVHVQKVTNSGAFSSAAPPSPVVAAPMSMGGFVTPRPVASLPVTYSSAPTVTPAK